MFCLYLYHPRFQNELTADEVQALGDLARSSPVQREKAELAMLKTSLESVPSPANTAAAKKEAIKKEAVKKEKEAEYTQARAAADSLTQQAQALAQAQAQAQTATAQSQSQPPLSSMTGSREVPPPASILDIPLPKIPLPPITPIVGAAMAAAASGD
jgi:hypothetical protein